MYQSKLFVLHGETHVTMCQHPGGGLLTAIVVSSGLDLSNVHVLYCPTFTATWTLWSRGAHNFFNERAKLSTNKLQKLFSISLNITSLCHRDSQGQQACTEIRFELTSDCTLMYFLVKAITSGYKYTVVRGPTVIFVQMVLSLCVCGVEFYVENRGESVTQIFRNSISFFFNLLDKTVQYIFTYIH